ncbi:lysine-specific demethylase JMJ25-like [Asparagus officinalis]|uniref:lysine-specific demethylase JMJ25-like n=1 Tax=Asparagus officinalis TaxID=4686 RepID=UPI00098E45EE|nr:lysine-specific demethylase JMJ25-like [Asparagus officinalis]
MEMSEERETDADPITEDLLRMAVKRQMERREEREEKKRREEREVQKRSEEKIEVRRHLRNGVMAISSPVNNSSNVVQIIDRKIGLEKIGLGFNEGSSFKRRFRSKNAEPEPIGVVKKLGRVLGRSKNTCHGRGKSTNCKRKGCNTCKPMGAIDAPFEKSTNGQSKVSRIRYADSSICQLLPVLKQPSWEQIFELETEANNQDRRLASVQLQVVECSDDVRFKCNYCRTSIVDLHRSCSKCCYKLCLSCCREIREESLAEGAKMVSHQDSIFIILQNFSV